MQTSCVVFLLNHVLISVPVQRNLQFIMLVKSSGTNPVTNLTITDDLRTNISVLKNIFLLIF